MVGLQGFEPWTSSTRTKRSTKLSHSPNFEGRKLGSALFGVKRKVAILSRNRRAERPVCPDSAVPVVFRARIAHPPPMSTHTTLPSRWLLPALLLATALPLHARLGETEAQSQLRYGAPAPELSAPTDKTLLEGAKEVIYNFQGWRVRAAFISGTTARIEYVHLPENNVPKQISEEEIRAILDSEKGAFSWKEDKPKTGNSGLNALKTLFEGRKWERTDHAQASMKANQLLTLESREVEGYEKKLAKQPKKATPPGAVLPKF